MSVGKPLKLFNGVMCGGVHKGLYNVESFVVQDLLSPEIRIRALLPIVSSLLRRDVAVGGLEDIAEVVLDQRFQNPSPSIEANVPCQRVGHCDGEFDQ